MHALEEMQEADSSMGAFLENTAVNADINNQEIKRTALVFTDSFDTAARGHNFVSCSLQDSGDHRPDFSVRLEQQDPADHNLVTLSCRCRSRLPKRHARPSVAALDSSSWPFGRRLS